MNLTNYSQNRIDRRKLKEEKVRRVLASDFSKFKSFIYSKYEHAQHLELLDDLLMQVSLFTQTGGAEGIGRLIIEMPPRHGKSFTVSRLYPLWHVGNNPDHRVMLVGYGASLAQKHSRFARNLMKSVQYRTVFPDVKLAQDSKAVDEWSIQNHEGGMSALGIGGAATGKGANILIIDDPIKNRSEAESKTYREKVWNSYRDDLLTRLEPGAAVIIIHTRWHTDDLIGRLLEREADDWYRLRLPALAEEDDMLGREPGTALWPERFNTETLLNMRRKRADYSWSSLYQQSPVVQKSGLFKTEHIEVIDYEPDCQKIVRFYDLAVTKSQHSDYTAGVKMGITKDNEFVILDLYHVKKKLYEVENDIVQNAKIDGKKCRIRLEAEKAGIIALDHLTQRKELNSYAIDKKRPVGDKYTRALPFASKVNTGMVKMCRGNWNSKLIEELRIFQGNGIAHDDIVDACSGAYDMLNSSKDKLLIMDYDL